MQKNTLDVYTLRTTAGLTQEALARSLGVALLTVSRWERHLAQPSPLAREKLDRLAAELDMPVLA